MGRRQWGEEARAAGTMEADTGVLGIHWLYQKLANLTSQN